MERFTEKLHQKLHCQEAEDPNDGIMSLSWCQTEDLFLLGI